MRKVQCYSSLLRHRECGRGSQRPTILSIDPPVHDVLAPYEIDRRYSRPLMM